MQVTADAPITAVDGTWSRSSPPPAAPSGTAAAETARRTPNTRPSRWAGTSRWSRDDSGVTYGAQISPPTARASIAGAIPVTTSRGRSAVPQARAFPARASPGRSPGVPVHTRRQAAELLELRDGLLRLVAAAPDPEGAAWLSGWFERTRLGVRVTAEGGSLGIGHAAPARSGLAGAVVEAVAEAVAGGTWSRLRRCPDCKLVFWDRTRNASKVWCGMYAGADGRACGSIAKVRRYRARRAGTTA